MLICAIAAWTAPPEMAVPVSLYVAANWPRRASGQLLLAGVKQWCASSCRPLPNLSLVRSTHGKPYLEHAPDIHFSVTHSGDFWLCAISAHPVGLDLQQIQKAPTRKLARRFFHPAEADYLEWNPDAFFKIWSAKESFVKLTGQGIDDSFSAFSMVKHGKIQTEMGGARFRFLPFAPTYTLCLCCRFPTEITTTELLRTPLAPCPGALV